MTLEPRGDGGLRAYSKEVPGFVLSHPDPQAVISDIIPALELMLSEMWGGKVTATHLESVSNNLDDSPARTPCTGAKEYVLELQ